MSGRGGSGLGLPMAALCNTSRTSLSSVTVCVLFNPQANRARSGKDRKLSRAAVTTLIDSENGNLSGGDFRRPQDFDKTGGDSDPLRLASPICDDAATDGASDFLAP